MRAYAEDGFEKRKLSCRKITHRALVALGQNAEWSLDGFNKFLAASFVIYGIHDKWAHCWLLYVVLPSNRFAAAIGVIFLRCIWKYEGILMTYSH
jgi:hypothetical protein